MYLNVERELTRCERIMRQRILSYLRQRILTRDVHNLDNADEPVPAAKFLSDGRSGQDDFSPFTLGSQWGTTWSGMATLRLTRRDILTTTKSTTEGK